MRTAVRTQGERSAALVAFGERAGFYEAMSEKPLTAAELAHRSGATTGFVRRWLTAQAKQGYVTHEVATDRFANWCSLPRAA